MNPYTGEIREFPSEVEAHAAGFTKPVTAADLIAAAQRADGAASAQRLGSPSMLVAVAGFAAAIAPPSRTTPIYTYPWERSRRNGHAISS